MSTTMKKRLLSIYNWMYKIIDAYAKVSLVAVVAIVSAQVIARTAYRGGWKEIRFRR